MSRHSAPNPGDQSRQDKGYETPRQADDAFQPPSDEQVAADTAQIDNQTYATRVASATYRPKQ